MPLLISGYQNAITNAPDIHFRLQYIDDSYLNTDGGYNLAESIRGFFERFGSSLYSLDDNGFDDYTLTFTEAPYLQPQGNEDTRQYIEILDAATGKIRVAEDPNNQGSPNAAAIDKNPVVKSSEEHTSEIHSLMRNSYAVIRTKKKNRIINN